MSNQRQRCLGPERLLWCGWLQQLCAAGCHCPFITTIAQVHVCQNQMCQHVVGFVARLIAFMFRHRISHPQLCAVFDHYFEFPGCR